MQKSLREGLFHPIKALEWSILVILINRNDVWVFLAEIGLKLCKNANFTLTLTVELMFLG